MEKSVVYENKYNLSLSGIYNKRNDSKVIVIICHGSGSNKNSRATKAIASYLNYYKINNFRFDFTACGDSQGRTTQITIKRLVEDLEVTIKYLQDKGYKEFILCGYSLGGRICSLIDTDKYNVTKLILWSPAIFYRNKLQVFKNKFIKGKKEKKAQLYGRYNMHGMRLSAKYFEEERTIDVFREMKKINKPILLVHGDKDQFVDYKNAVKIAKEYDNVELVTVKGENHGFKKSDNNLRYACIKSVEFITGDKILK